MDQLILHDGDAEAVDYVYVVPPWQGGRLGAARRAPGAWVAARAAAVERVRIIIRGCRDAAVVQELNAALVALMSREVRTSVQRANSEGSRGLV